MANQAFQITLTSRLSWNRTYGYGLTYANKIAANGVVFIAVYNLFAIVL